MIFSITGYSKVNMKEIMMPTKLILIEGLPGSGKSTTARMIHEILQDKGIKSELFLEGNLNHPADYDGVAYFTKNEYQKLEQGRYSCKGILDRIKREHYNGYLIPYRKAIEEQGIIFEDNFLNDIIKKDIYELPIDIHRKLILNRWEDYVHQYRNKDQVVIFECCFIQNPLTVTMIRNNEPKKITVDYTNRLAKIVAPLEPILLYLEQENIEASFKKVIDERPRAWFEGFIDYYTNQGYGLENNFNGVEGVIGILKERHAFEQEIYQSLPLNKYIIDNSAYDRSSHIKQIKSILETAPF